jgi:hypothetical protein
LVYGFGSVTLEKGVKVSFCRKGQSKIAKYFSTEGDLVYFNDTCELTEEIQLQYVPEQWRLLIDSCKVILKAVLLHNGNKHLSILSAHAVRMKETYANIQGLLKKNMTRRPPMEHIC